MRIVHCAKGHIYDSDLYSSCPSCQSEGVRIDFGAGSVSAPAKTEQTFFRPPVSSAPQGIGKTEAAPGGFGAQAVLNKTVAAPGGFESRTGPNKTVMVGIGGKEVESGSAGMPVVGWLVCVKGPNAGRSFEIHTDYNYLGSVSGDIIIPGDRKISREKHMKITFDPDERLFYVSPEAGANIIRLNGRALVGGAEIHNYDYIETGDSGFMFMAFCSERFGWDDVE